MAFTTIIVEFSFLVQTGVRHTRHPPIARHRHRDKPIASGSPWQNGFAERLIGSIRRECVDHVVVLGKRTYAGFWRNMPPIITS